MSELFKDIFFSPAVKGSLGLVQKSEKEPEQSEVAEKPVEETKTDEPKPEPASTK